MHASALHETVAVLRESISVGHCWPVLLPDIVLVASGPASGPVLCIGHPFVWAVHSRCKLGKRVDVEQLRGDVNGDNDDAHLATCAAASDNDHPDGLPPSSQSPDPPLLLSSLVASEPQHTQAHSVNVDRPNHPDVSYPALCSLTPNSTLSLVAIMAHVSALFTTSASITTDPHKFQSKTEDVGSSQNGFKTCGN